jgi:hypothetical protein
MRYFESLSAGKEICVRRVFDILKEFIIEATCLILLALTAWEIIKKNIGF